MQQIQLYHPGQWSQDIFAESFAQFALWMFLKGGASQFEMKCWWKTDAVSFQQITFSVFLWGTSCASCANNL